MIKWANDVLARFRGRVDGDEVTLAVCPACGNRKWNMQLSITKGVYHCWACGASGTVKSFLVQQGISFDASEFQFKAVAVKEEERLALPANVPILQSMSQTQHRAVEYLWFRGMSDDLIREWDVRYGLEGAWAGWTLFPFYGMEGLEYFLGLNHRVNPKYKGPAAGKDRFCPKRRNETGCIVLVEGVFDGLSVWKHTRHDVMILFGKFIGEKRKELLVASNYDRVYVCLDADAQKEAIALAETLRLAGCRPWFVTLPEDSDPDELEEEIAGLIDMAQPFKETSASKMRRELVNATA